MWFWLLLVVGWCVSGAYLFLCLLYWMLIVVFDWLWGVVNSVALVDSLLMLCI